MRKFRNKCLIKIVLIYIEGMWFYSTSFDKKIGLNTQKKKESKFSVNWKWFLLSTSMILKLVDDFFFIFTKIGVNEKWMKL